MKHSILIMMFGQSNADAHNAGPAIQSAFLDTPAVVAPNDGRGIQGLRGQPRKTDITGFVPSYNPRAPIQSIAAAIGCGLWSGAHTPNLKRIIARSAAQGGRPLHGNFNHGRHLEGIHLDGFGNRSSLYQTLITDIRQIRDAAIAGGAPLRHIYIPFFHGEADRSMGRAAYADGLRALMDDADADIAAMGLGATWLLTQSSGTGPGYIGNGWANRLSLCDVAQTRPNAHLIAANYAYALEDSIHLNATAKALMGEFIAHQITALEAGTNPSITRLLDTIITGQTIDLHFHSPHGLVLDQSQFPAPGHTMGFNIARQRDQAITRVEQTGRDTVRLHCARPLDGAQTQINYAFQTVRADTSQEHTSSYAIGRGCLREDWSRPSQILPGTSLFNWAPGFSVCLADVAVPALAA